MTRRPLSARASGRSCSRPSRSCSARTPTSRCAGSRAASCGNRAKRSAMIFNFTNRRPPRRASADRTVPKGQSGVEPTGVRAARTRIRGIASRKKIAPSARGRRKIQRRSAIATNPATSRSRAASGATNRWDRLAAIGRGRSRPAIGHGRPSRAGIGPGRNNPKAKLIGCGRRRSDRTIPAVARPIIARAKAGASVLPSLDHGATNPRARRVQIGRGPKRRRETVAGARSRRAQATGRGAETHPTASRGATNRRRPTTGRGRPNPPAPARSGSRGSASRRATRRAAIGRGPTTRQTVDRAAIDRGTLSGLLVSSVHGRRSRQVRREAIGRGAASRRPTAIENRGKRNRSDRAVRQGRMRAAATRARASGATMNRPIATDARRCSRC